MMNSRKILSILLSMKYSEIKPIIGKLQCGDKVLINGHTITSLGFKTVCKNDLHFLLVELGDKFVGKIGV